MAAVDRICFLKDQRAYCGRRGKGATPFQARVTCEDCKAALRADEADES
jgi:hypothetical protein